MKKQNAIEAALSLPRSGPERYVLLYQDEGSFYRQPMQAWLWVYMGLLQPRLPYSHRANTRMRVVGYLHTVTGAVHNHDMSTVTARRLAKSAAEIARWYPGAERIFLVWDNWPVHRHPLVEAALARLPRIHVLWLPTYYPWLNAIEKLWRWVRHRVSHTHPWSDDFTQFRSQIRIELANLSQGSEELLDYS